MTLLGLTGPRASMLHSNWLGGLPHMPHLSTYEIEIISPPPRTAWGGIKEDGENESAWKLKDSSEGGYHY